MNNALKDVQFRIEEEGLDYAIRKYSKWRDISDVKFHALKEGYLAAAQALEGYINDHAIGITELTDDASSRADTCPHCWGDPCVCSEDDIQPDQGDK
jgi:hypothetical protein